MFIHLGEKCIVRKKDIVGIFDIENTSVSAITKNNKYFVLDKCDNKCRVMISHNTNARAYKCYSNKDGQMFVPNTSIYTVPKGFTSCGFNEVLDFCTQLSLTLF